MTWQSVARKDFRDSLRSRWLWVLTALFVVLFAVPPILAFLIENGSIQGSAGQSTDQYLYLMKQETAVLIPLISIVIGYAAITGERESGTLKLMLSLPHSRTDVVLGKVLGRSSVVGISTVLGFVVAAIILLVTSLTFKFVNYVLFASLTLLLGLVFVGLAVGISAAAKTGRRAMVTTISFYIVFLVLWSGLAKRVASLLGRYAGVGTAGQISTILFIRLLNPMTAYKTLVDTILLSSQLDARVLLFNRYLQSTVATILGKPIPIYFSDAFVIVYLLFWLFVPVAVGYYVFDRADL
ncbi:ABC-type transport system permease protein [Haladaptatus paucihalophilus DX253]|uniref:ABC-2 type transport system permease protein n=1 Tax=Haladaptatus paucihalophilus DX253 TaxID=797209 RepID=E7QN55_HALPU|nr:ABC transporter permease [Haladaptatus paucihalophilus]EFW93850.1 ABC-type transport system permease protein [Haladaptatus paucihalophilus DX253]SHL53128.1 ABC-2 type transport system permease protein [Haladaptatus paucihalophilus DX253]